MELNEFLPNEWHVVAKDESQNKILTDWINKNLELIPDRSDKPKNLCFLGRGQDLFSSDFHCGSIIGEEISFYTFSKYVLNGFKPKVEHEDMSYLIEILNKLDIK